MMSNKRMARIDDILNGYEKVQLSVPDGYFDSLKDRLNDIPAAGRKFSFTPYLSLAASFVVLFIAGSLLLNLTAGRTEIDDEQAFQETFVAEIIPVTEQYETMMLLSDAEEEEISEDDIINYLIESGTSMEAIEE